MIYRFGMVTGRKDGFYREYELKKENTLYDFHRHIQNDLDFDEAQMAAFYTSDNNWNEFIQYALFDMGNGAMDSIFLQDLIENNVTHLVYTFDFFNNRSLLISFLDETDEDRRSHYPRTSEAKGTPPDQLIDKAVPDLLPIEDILNQDKNDSKTNSKSSKKGKGKKEELPVDDFLDEDDELDEEDSDLFDDSDFNFLSETDEV